MKSRILLKEIPSGKFHSAIFTTYSINLYYLEQQVLPLLGSKDIHYISILVDGTMLSSQLEYYGQLSQQRKRNYAIHGIQSKGAFHPKMIFLAGQDVILLLLGSGNLTTSGHGKNLEVWNPIYVDNAGDKKYGFVIQAWNYLKDLHTDLGDSAQNKMKNIEENCTLLSNSLEIETSAAFELESTQKISFHTNRIGSSLFSQVSTVIGDDKIVRITIMCPYHDAEGKFIQELNNRYEPGEINVLVQEDFGALPHKMQPQPNVRFFDWASVMQEKFRQYYFHAKNIVFEGKENNYLVSGSANASIAAFGTLEIPAINQETCIIYQSSKTDYLDTLGIKINGNAVSLYEYEQQVDETHINSENGLFSVFIKSAEKNYNSIWIRLISKISIEKAILNLCDAAGGVQSEKEISIEIGNNSFQWEVSPGIPLMYAEIFVNTKRSSNKQFVIDVHAFESTNPSPSNRALNQIRKLIESGNFLTSKIIDYLKTIHRQKEFKKGITVSNTQEEQNEEMPPEQENDLHYLSYAEIQERSRQINDLKKASHYIEYKGVRLWDSIFSYLKENREKELQAKIDEEETEDVNKSSGRSNAKKSETKKPISKSNYERQKEKVEKFLDNYWEILLNKTEDKNSEKPSLIDLSMYLIMLEILLHLVEQKEKIEEEEKEKYLLQISFSNKEFSWSDYLIQFINMFAIWYTKNGGYKEFEDKGYELKLEHYNDMAFKTNLSALAIFSLENKRYDKAKLRQWLQISLLNTNQVFNSLNTKSKEIEEFVAFIPQIAIEEIGEGVITDEIMHNLNFLETYKAQKLHFEVGDYFNHPEIGFTWIDKIIENPKNIFFKLFTPGFEWDSELNNFWNGCVYSITENRWLKSRKD